MYQNQSYKVTVVGGVVHKNPLEKESAVVMRSRSKVKHANRRVSCKDLGSGDCEGWLYKRQGGRRLLADDWVKRWCIIKDHYMYIYETTEDLKAEVLLHLPAFQISPAPEVKTEHFAFKVHHSGTTFVFASERQNDMIKWTNKMRDSTKYTDKRTEAREQDDFYSESSDEEYSNKDSSKSTEPKTGSAISRGSNGLSHLMDNIHREQLSFDGKNKRKQRTSAILPITNTLHNDYIEAEKRKLSLLRTLKAKEIELQELEAILQNRNIKESLRKYKDMLLEVIWV